jgi:hypothetical protein
MQNSISDSIMWLTLLCLQNTSQMKIEGKTGHYEGFIDYLMTVLQ